MCVIDVPSVIGRLEGLAGRLGCVQSEQHNVDGFVPKTVRTFFFTYTQRERR